MEFNDGWYTIKESIEILGISRKTLYRRMDSGEIESKKVGSARFVKIGDPEETQTVSDDTSQTVSDDTVCDTNDVIRNQQGEIEFLRSQVEYLQTELSDTKTRSDTMILKLTQTVDNQQLLLIESKTPFWKKLFGLAGSTT
tara:strand:- start:103 stop:525 length:423 start_codon:yes stop_codon:yes gene_type:complete